ncbi:MAG: ATPase [SAR324 cluster bacterium]|uniref:ATPase n=1 Tax=SAR324 cluster bacterium TaxID=2024889 RepID=A0A2A4SW75_9DELT|nr:MAG: ATPase [SAR324 cluster bacterium]
MYGQIKELESLIKEESLKIQDVRAEIAKTIIGQEYMIERMLIGLLTGGHILLEGLPGLAKTLAVNCLSQTLNANFSRVQFTPDMLPADLVGTNIFNPKDGTFTPKKGPVFTNVLLADEINRAPAKVQSALLEVMQEKQVTLAGTTYKLEKPFLVLATQNPIEQEGTYPLPEAQIDRFMMKLKIEYPSKQEEREILNRVTSFSQEIATRQILSKEEVLNMQKIVEDIYVDDKIKDYIVNLVDATRNPESYGLSSLSGLIEVGASPRATITLAIASRAYAFLQGKGFVSPQDIKAIAPDVLRHRIMVTYEAEAEEKTSDHIVQTLLSEIPVP